jgi:hypothetical protein
MLLEYSWSSIERINNALQLPALFMQSTNILTLCRRRDVNLTLSYSSCVKLAQLKILVGRSLEKRPIRLTYEFEAPVSLVSFERTTYQLHGDFASSTRSSSASFWLQRTSLHTARLLHTRRWNSNNACCRCSFNVIARNRNPAAHALLLVR